MAPVTTVKRQELAYASRSLSCCVIRLAASRGFEPLPAGGRTVTEPLAGRWDALIQAVHRELEREGRTRAVQLSHDPRALRLSARRPLSDRKVEWITVNFTPDEVLGRAPEELAREFARTYYSCS